MLSSPSLSPLLESAAIGATGLRCRRGCFPWPPPVTIPSVTETNSRQSTAITDRRRSSTPSSLFRERCRYTLRRRRQSPSTVPPSLFDDFGQKSFSHSPMSLYILDKFLVSKFSWFGKGWVFIEWKCCLVVELV